MTDLLTQIESIVKEAGESLLHAVSGTVYEKDGIGNFVTDRDVSTQKFLYEKLSALLPEASFVGEEDETFAGASKTGLCFVIDPIDGTANFIRKANYSSISVGLLKDGAPFLGVVMNPWTGELYKAEKGKGAFLNDCPIRVSEKAFKDGIAVIGFTSYHREYDTLQFKIFRNLFSHCQDLRCLGSAALDICGVACGRWESFTELVLKPWDYCAGMCILEEAGGVLTCADGSEILFEGSHSVLAASKSCYDEVLRLVNS